MMAFTTETCELISLMMMMMMMMMMMHWLHYCSVLVMCDFFRWKITLHISTMPCAYGRLYRRTQLQITVAAIFTLKTWHLQVSLSSLCYSSDNVCRVATAFLHLFRVLIYNFDQMLKTSSKRVPSSRRVCITTMALSPDVPYVTDRLQRVLKAQIPLGPVSP